MVNVNRIISSNHKFTDPIRLFKGNDPYQFQIDNIPLEQLQENTRWLKDQILNFDVEVTDLNRDSWGELQPCFSGTGRTVTVSPGRFSARINDAYGLSSLQEFSFVNDNNFWDGIPRKLESTAAQITTVTEILDSLINSSGTGKVSINGLEVRAIDWLYNLPNFDMVEAINEDSTGYPFYDGPYLDGERAWPLLDTRYLTKGLQSSTPIALLDDSKLGQHLQNLSMEFVRRWRGISRLSIVDVAEPLTLDIPEFSDDDFFVINDDGVSSTGGTVRIDLLFVYSKAIDAESATIQGGTTVRTITKPELGLVKGAGLGFLNNSSYLEVSNRDETEKGTFFDPETGNYKIAPDVSNEDTSKTNGFSQGPLSTNRVRGTFPSPDDLLNLAPQLLNDLESTDPRLIGQTVLPLAYVVVTKPDAEDVVNSVGQYPLTNDSIIDIRPFFRTAELTYNERAGISAATPQLSLANPAVGKAELQQSILEVRRSITEIEDSKQSSVIAKGTLYGGILYGPEGAILAEGGLTFDQVYDTNGQLSAAAKEILDYAENEEVKVPLYPQWNIASHSALSPDAGSYMGDWMDARVITSRPGFNGQNSELKVDNVPYGYDNTVRSSLGLPVGFDNPDAVEGLPGWDFGRNMMIRSSRKEFYLHNIPDWVQDIVVTTKYINCYPTQGDGEFPGVGGVTVSKSAIYGPGESGPTYLPGIVFPGSRSAKIMLISWVAGHSGQGQDLTEQYPGHSRNNPMMSAYLVAKGSTRSDGLIVNKCMYPTVEFSIEGVNNKVSTPQNTGFGFAVDDFPEESTALTQEQLRTLVIPNYNSRTQKIKAT